MDNQSLTCKVISFSSFLKDRGFKIFSSNIMDSLNSIEEVDISKREDFFHVLRTNLVTSDVEWALFEGLFEEYWQGIENEEEEEESEIPQAQLECGEDAATELFQEVQREQDEGGEEDAGREEPTEQATYSPVARLERKNLAHFQKADVQIAQLILKNMLSPFRLSVTRRFKGSKKPGDMDFRRIMKNSLKLGGIPLELFYKKKKEEAEAVGHLG